MSLDTDVQLNLDNDGDIEGCPDCGSTDISDEGERCAECAAGYLEHIRDAKREDEIADAYVESKK